MKRGNKIKSTIPDLDTQRLSEVIHSWPSYLMALVAGSLHLLTQFIYSHGLRLLFAIS